MRTGYTPGYNEPVYHYRETKLEQVPRPRNNPTWHSSVLGSGSYNFPQTQPVNPQNFSLLKKIKIAQSVQSDSQSNFRGETNHQRQYHKTGYPDYVPQRNAPMSPTKPYSKNKY